MKKMEKRQDYLLVNVKHISFRYSSTIFGIVECKSAVDYMLGKAVEPAPAAVAAPRFAWLVAFEPHHAP